MWKFAQGKSAIKYGSSEYLLADGIAIREGTFNNKPLIKKLQAGGELTELKTSGEPNQNPLALLTIYSWELLVIGYICAFSSPMSHTHLTSSCDHEYLGKGMGYTVLWLMVKQLLPDDIWQRRNLLNSLKTPCIDFTICNLEARMFFTTAKMQVEVSTLRDALASQMHCLLIQHRRLMTLPIQINYVLTDVIWVNIHCLCWITGTKAWSPPSQPLNV